MRAKAFGLRTRHHRSDLNSELNSVVLGTDEMFNASYLPQAGAVNHLLIICFPPATFTLA